MSNFKSGSGNLDFGSNDDEETETDSTGAESSPEVETGDESGQSEQATEEQPSKEEIKGDTDSSEESSDRENDVQTIQNTTGHSDYPYFVRRNNVGDERDIRLEIHVRDRVAAQEASFRSEVAKELGVSEISKTDAREFALLAAFEHPEKVAELMREEGFGALG